MIQAYDDLMIHFSQYWSNFSNFQAFYDGFLSHEFKLPVDIRVKKLLVTFSNLEQMILAILQSLYYLEWSATVTSALGKSL